MSIYIRSASSISAQETFQSEGFLTDVIPYEGTRLKAIEPDYKEYIDPKLIRRMSHVIKMGVAAAKKCLNNAGVAMPGAIVTGTAYGCLEDTASFLSRLIEFNEELLTPTSFIQSTHNTVAAQIALMLQCHAYNNTFVHKGISFESALLDAMMLLQEQEADNILVGSTDEMTDTSFTILTRLGLYKRNPVSNLSIINSQTKGTISGEGAAFFLLTDKQSADNLAELKASQIIYKPNGLDDIRTKVIAFLSENDLTVDDVDLIITGKNGDTRHDEIYNDFNQSLFQHDSIANYKPLCGEYPTSISFALWLASNIVSMGVIPDIVLEKRSTQASPKNVLIYNHYQNIYHSLMLVTKC